MEGKGRWKTNKQMQAITNSKTRLVSSVHIGQRTVCWCLMSICRGQSALIGQILHVLAGWAWQKYLAVVRCSPLEPETRDETGNSHRQYIDVSCVWGCNTTNKYHSNVPSISYTNIHSQNYTLPCPALYGVQGWSLKTAKLCRKRKLEVFSLGLFGNPQISELIIFVKFTLYKLYSLHFTLTSVKYPQKQVLAASSVCRSGERTGTGLGAQAGSSGEGGKVTSTRGQMYQ